MSEFIESIAEVIVTEHGTAAAAFALDRSTSAWANEDFRAAENWNQVFLTIQSGFRRTD